MKKFAENLADLLKVKTIVTFVVLYVFAKACNAGLIPSSEITTIVGMVFAFYFGTQADKKSAAPTRRPRKESAENDDNG